MRQWNGKPYHSLDFFLREQFGEKVYKVTLNGGMTCPNRDGTLGTRGCIFCSAGGSGDFAASASLSITEQIESQIHLLETKRPIQKYIAYFQAYTNTYGEIRHLRRIFTEALSHPKIVALSIGTRPDCLGADVLALLEELNDWKPVWIELDSRPCMKTPPATSGEAIPFPALNRRQTLWHGATFPSLFTQSLAFRGNLRNRSWRP